MQLIDSHCHLDFAEFDPDRPHILQHCHQLGFRAILVPGVSAARWPRLLAVCAQSDLLYPALGLHPLFLAQHSADDLDRLTDAIDRNQVIAIGEIGLDFYRKDIDRAQQIHLFRQQLMIARQADLPVLLHVRKAHDDVIQLLKSCAVKGGIVHAFNGSLEQARRYQELGFLFGIGGAITHPKATRLRALCQALPLTSLVLETDAPDMPLFNQQNSRNTPENIPRILAELAALRQEAPQTIAEITTRNGCQLLALH